MKSAVLDMRAPLLRSCRQAAGHGQNIHIIASTTQTQMTSSVPRSIFPLITATILVEMPDRTLAPPERDRRTMRERCELDEVGEPDGLAGDVQGLVLGESRLPPHLRLVDRRVCQPFERPSHMLPVTTATPAP
jgi:hypothetical protein